jgi:hypothetical protein
MRKIQNDKKTPRATTRPGLAPKKRSVRNAKSLFKYMDRSGWEQNSTALNFDIVMKKLKKLREAGRQDAIIVDSGFKLRNSFRG